MPSRDEASRLAPGDAALIDRLHGGLPLVDHPFAVVGAELGMSEEAVIERLSQLLAHGVLTRFGPLYQIERAGGAFVLVALAVPEARFDAVAALVNAQPEVAHNYRRESVGPLDAARRPSEKDSLRGAAQRSALNMWFVVAAESPQAAEAAITRIEALTGLPALRLPKEREFVVELRLPIAETRHAAH